MDMVLAADFSPRHGAIVAVGNGTVAARVYPGPEVHPPYWTGPGNKAETAGLKMADWLYQFTLFSSHSLGLRGHLGPKPSLVLDFSVQTMSFMPGRGYATSWAFIIGSFMTMMGDAFPVVPVPPGKVRSVLGLKVTSTKATVHNTFKVLYPEYYTAAMDALDLTLSPKFGEKKGRVTGKTLTQEIGTDILDATILALASQDL